MVGTLQLVKRFGLTDGISASKIGQSSLNLKIDPILRAFIFFALGLAS
jgi:hypothetical protein